jgi:hypothetical protein
MVDDDNMNDAKRTSLDALMKRHTSEVEFVGEHLDWRMFDDDATTAAGLSAKPPAAAKAGSSLLTRSPKGHK